MHVCVLTSGQLPAHLSTYSAPCLHAFVSACPQQLALPAHTRVAPTDIKQRVRKEVFEGREARGWHRQGAELAAAAVLSFAVASYVLYARYTGWLAGLVLGGRRKQLLKKRATVQMRCALLSISCRLVTVLQLRMRSLGVHLYRGSCAVLIIKSRST
jgi:hypothetical protein